MRAHRTVTAAAAFVLIAALPGCAPGENECLPAPLVAELHDVDGEFTLELSASGVECDPSTGDDYTVAIIADAQRFSLGAVEPAADGGFREQFPVPAELIGRADAIVLVEGSRYDECADNADCQTYQVQLPPST